MTSPSKTRKARITGRRSADGHTSTTRSLIVSFSGIPTRPMEHYSRNRRIMQALKPLRLVEEHGEGVDRMHREMEARLMEPPIFVATSSSVTVTLRNRSLVEVVDQAWLAQLSAYPLSSPERLALGDRPPGRCSHASYDVKGEATTRGDLGRSPEGATAPTPKDMRGDRGRSRIARDPQDSDTRHRTGRDGPRPGWPHRLVVP